MTPSHTIRTALSGTMEAQALGRAEARRLFNPDSEVNSLAERLMALRTFGVPQDCLRSIFADLRAVIDLNTAQCGEEASVAGQLDELATVLHRAETEAHVSCSLGIKSLARALRPALEVIAAPARHAACVNVEAVRVIDRIISDTAPSRLLGPTLRHELGAGKHDLLADLMGAIA